MEKVKSTVRQLISKGIIMLSLMMLLTTPTRERFDQWIIQEFGVDCEIDNNFVNVCYLTWKEIKNKSSHFRNAAIYASYEINYELESGEKVTYRTHGVLGTLFQMKDGYLWEVLN